MRAATQLFPSPVRVLALVGCATAYLSAAPAAAQDWLFVPLAEDESAAAALAEAVRPDFIAAGATFLDAEGASLAFEQDISAPATSLTQSELDQWADRSRSALQALALADYDTARQELLEAQRVSQQAAEELNREAERAREVLDTCLFMARAMLETRQRAEALRQVRTCRVLVPELQPRLVRHTPEVRELLDRVDSEDSGADLRVTSTPGGCIVRVNGTPQGETPFAMQNIARGEYRVQVECTEARGRVHRVLVDEGVAEVHVDAAFDEGVQSRPLLFAQTGTDASAAGARIARELNRTVIVAMADGEGLRYLRFDASGSSAEVRTRQSNRAEAARHIVEGQSMDLRFDAPQALGADTADADEAEEADEPDAPRAGLPGWRIGVGLGAAAAGVGLIAFSAVLHGDRVEAGDGLANLTDEEVRGPGFIPNQQAWLDEGLGPIAGLAFAGGAVMSVGAALLVPPREDVPWWAWASGGVGLVIGGAALIPVLTRPSCEGDGIRSLEQGVRRDCVDSGLAGSRAAIIGAAALPFLAVPISSLLQRGRSEDTTALRLNTSVSQGRFSLQLNGSF
ncbi:MAG: PEGA domain-containing protein [Myxococcota bacterium]